MSQIPNETEEKFNMWLHDTLVIPKPDSIVTSIIMKFSERAQMGKGKYGVTLDREDLSLLDFINHALEEHMDAILYLQKAKTLIEKNQNN